MPIGLQRKHFSAFDCDVCIDCAENRWLLLFLNNTSTKPIQCNRDASKYFVLGPPWLPDVPVLIKSSQKMTSDGFVVLPSGDCLCKVVTTTGKWAEAFLCCCNSDCWHKYILNELHFYMYRQASRNAEAEDYYRKAVDLKPEVKLVLISLFD